MGPHHAIKGAILAVGVAGQCSVYADGALCQQHPHARHKEWNGQGVELNELVRGHGVGEEDNCWVGGGIVQHKMRVGLRGRLEDKPRAHLRQGVLPEVKHQHLLPSWRVAVPVGTHVQSTVAEEWDRGHPCVVLHVLQVVLVLGSDRVLRISPRGQHANVLVQSFPLSLCAASQIVAVGRRKHEGLVERHPQLTSRGRKATDKRISRHDLWVALVELEIGTDQTLRQFGVGCGQRVDKRVGKVRVHAHPR